MYILFCTGCISRGIWTLNHLHLPLQAVLAHHSGTACSCFSLTCVYPQQGISRWIDRTPLSSQLDCPGRSEHYRSDLPPVHPYHVILLVFITTTTIHRCNDFI